MTTDANIDTNNSIMKALNDILFSFFDWLQDIHIHLSSSYFFGISYLCVSVTFVKFSWMNLFGYTKEHVQLMVYSIVFYFCFNCKFAFCNFTCICI